MALAYLLCPTFQIENTAGKPATGGWLEVYVAGSRTKYYCASDFDGTLHPFRIPLDSLGSNIVLADDAGSYDVYVYNRYGGEMMSRYNVKPGSGGGIGSITSADGSIIITPTENGLDLRTNSKAPSILRATAQNLSADGQFQFSELQRDGQDAVVDTNGRVMVNEGWWHFDATVRLRWPGDPNVNGTQSISLYTANASDSTSFDLSYAHSDTIQVNGEFKAENDGTQFVLGVTGVQPGMTVELVDYGIHSIIGEGAGGKYNAGDGIDIDEPNRVISVDFDEVQEKLTAGTGITIDNEGVISVDESAIQEIFPVTYNSTTFQEIRTALIAGKLPVMFRNDGADIALQVQRIPLHTFFNVGGSLGSSYAQFWSPYVYTSSSPSLPPYALFAVYSASYDFETHNTTWSTSYKYISEQSDWAESDATKLTFIKNKPDLSVYATGAELTAGLATKQDTLTAGTGIAIDSNNVISSTVSENTFNAIYGVTTLSEIEDAVEAGNAVVVTGIPSEPGMTLPLVTFRPNLNSATFYAYTLTAAYLVSIGPAGHWEYHVYGAQADWNESTSSAPAYIKNKPTIPSGSQLVPAATSSDAGEVLTVDQNGDPAWAPAQAPISAGNGIDITNNVVSAKVDGTSVTFNASGELETIAAPQVQSNWTEADPTDVSFIRNKPDQTNLVAGTNITIVDDAQNNTVTISAASVSVPVQDVTIDNVSVVNAQGVAEIPRQVNADWNSSAGASEILNKPTIPPALSAGNGIDITNNVISADLDGTSLTNGANGLSVTLPVPDTTGASQGDVLAVGQNGLEWITPTSDMFFATYGTTTFSDIITAHNAGKMVFLYAPCPNIASTGYLLPLAQIFLSNYDSQSFARFNGVFTNNNGAVGYAGSNLYMVTGENVWSTTYQSTITVPGSSDIGKVYKATANGIAGWGVVNEVPASTTTDENKVLTVNSSGNAEWATSSVPVIGTVTL